MFKEWSGGKGHTEGGKSVYIHPAWYSFIKYCESMKSGKIEKLKVQDGRPVIAEEVKSKVSFDE